MDKEKEIINIIRNCFPRIQDFSDEDIITVYKGVAVWETIEKIILEIKKQAVKEFVDYAKQVIVKQFSDTEMEKIKTVGALQLLYNKIEELYGNES